GGRAPRPRRLPRSPCELGPRCAGADPPQRDRGDTVNRTRTIAPPALPASVMIWPTGAGAPPLGAAGAPPGIIAAAGEPAAYCATDTPVILRSGPPPGTQRARAAVCTGNVAVRAFSHALCTCEGYATSTALTTDSFDSAAGPYAPGGTTGDVAI